MAKKITAPHSYDPGKGRPKEYLAYLNQREMDYLRSINGNNMERGPRGLPSFPPEDAVGSSSKAGSRGPGGPSGPNSGPSRSTTSGGGGKGPGGPSGPNSSPSRSTGGGGNLGGGGKGPGGPSGPNSSPSRSGGPSTSGGGNKGPGGPSGPNSSPSRSISSPMGGQGPSFSSPKSAGGYNADRANLQRAQEKYTRSAIQNTPAARKDLAVGGIKTLSVGPMGTPVNVGPKVAPTKNKTSVAGGWGVAGVGIAQQGVPNAPSPSTFGRPEGTAVRDIIAGYSPVPANTAVPIPNMNPLNDPAKFKLSNPNILQGVDPVALSKVVRLQEMAGVPLSITSGYRNPLLNKRVGGAQRSQHMQGNAIDIKIPGATAAETADFIKKASSVGFGGIGGYRPGSVHVDVASQRSWGPNYSGVTIGGPMGEALKSHSAGKIPEAKIDYAAMERNPSVRAPSANTSFASLKGFGFTTPAVASDSPTGPLMSGGSSTANSRLAGTGYGAFNTPDAVNRAVEKTVETVNTPQNKSVTEFDGSYGPQNVSKEVQKEMEDIDTFNRRVTKAVKSAPIIGAPLRLADGVRKLFTGKTTSEADADLKRAYMQAGPAERAALEKKNPNLTKFAQMSGEEPQLPMSNYDNWRQRSFGTGGGRGGSTSITSQGGGTPDIGSGGKNEPIRVKQAEKDTTKPKPKNKEGGKRPAIYYKWDLGVSVPSPTDSDYTLYLKYLQEKAAAKAAVA